MSNTRRPLAADPEAETNAVVPAAVRQSRPGRPAAVPRSRQASLIVIGDDMQEADDDGSVEVNLVGQVYRVTPPKSASAMRIAWLAAEKNVNPDDLFAALDQWIDKAFGPDQAENVRFRMYDDDKDPLDFQHIMALMQKLIELRSGGLPTTRR